MNFFPMKVIQIILFLFSLIIIFTSKEITQPLKKASQTISQNRSIAQMLALTIIVCCFLTSMTPLVPMRKIAIYLHEYLIFLLILVVFSPDQT